MKIAYLDCPAGASGDMLLGALLDAGVPLEDLRAGLAGLNLPGYELKVERVMKQAISATHVEVQVQDEATERHLDQILDIVRASRLPEPIKTRAEAIFTRIGTVEAAIHGLPVEQVHLHELGGLDTIIDVVGVLLGLDLLGVERLVASPLPLGSGTIQTAHGSIPLPAPATLRLLEGVPVVGSDIQKELVTPTGAALLANLVEHFGNLPPMRLLRTGYGAGKRDLPIPNVLRLLLGEAPDPVGLAGTYQAEKLVCLETNLDNLNPEVYPYVSERLFECGALDVTLAAVQMKKNRPGTLLSVLCASDSVEDLLRILFNETSTLGVRRYEVERYSLERSIQEVETPYGKLNVKWTHRPDGSRTCSPEYEDCRRIALQHGVSIREVYRAAEQAAQTRLEGSTS